MNKKVNHGFTIVELLVVIVVIGILAAITIVSYSGITNKANTAKGQANAGSILKKASVYNIDGPILNWPTTYGSLTNSAATTSYYTNNIPFTTISSAATTPAMTTAPATTGTLEFYLCGTGSTAAATKYGDVTVITGMKIGYWNHSSVGSLDTSTVLGSVSGNWTNGYAINCYKVGLADSAIAVARAIYNETGTWPATATSINNNTAAGAKLPAGMTVGITAPTSGTGTTTVIFQCGSAVNGAGPCNNTGGRIGFWDYTNGTPQVIYESYGTSTNFWTPAS